jgi:hypothetical protein
VLLPANVSAADPELGPIFKDSKSNMLVLRKHTTYFIHQVLLVVHAAYTAAAVGTAGLQELKDTAAAVRAASCN